MIETLFICNPLAKETTKRPALPTPKAENKVLDPKKAQNIAILLRALNVTKEEVCDALCEGEQDPSRTQSSVILNTVATYMLHWIQKFEFRSASRAEHGLVVFSVH
jgi:hypothetical protein